MKKLFEKTNSEKGMVTIEATIALTTFLFAFMMIFSIITICRVQAKMQVALNNTAQEISQYSYIYGIMGKDEYGNCLLDKWREIKPKFAELSQLPFI